MLGKAYAHFGALRTDARAQGVGILGYIGVVHPRDLRAIDTEIGIFLLDLHHKRIGVGSGRVGRGCRLGKRGHGDCKGNRGGIKLLRHLHENHLDL